MIYSTETNKICALCQMAQRQENGDIFCEKKGKYFAAGNEACKKFRYDILKKNVKRMRRLKTDFKKEDFTI